MIYDAILVNVSHVLEINVHFSVVDAVIFKSIVFVNHTGPSLPLGQWFSSPCFWYSVYGEIPGCTAQVELRSSYNLLESLSHICSSPLHAFTLWLPEDSPSGPLTQCRGYLVSSLCCVLPWIDSPRWLSGEIIQKYHNSHFSQKFFFTERNTDLSQSFRCLPCCYWVFHHRVTDLGLGLPSTHVIYTSVYSS